MAYGNTLKAKGGVVLKDCTDCVIQGTVIHGAHGPDAGITIQNGQRINVADCVITDCDGAGVWLKNSSQCRVGGCIIRDGRPAADGGPTAVIVSGGLGNRVTDNLTDGRLLIDPNAARVE